MDLINNMKTVLILLSCCVICLGFPGCCKTPDVDSYGTMLVLKYRDFGPQAAAWETIGMEWWQWDNIGDCDPNTKYDIKVIVYRNVPLSEVEHRYPVNAKCKQDYRYLSYEKALAYLDLNSKNELFRTEILETKAKIIQSLGAQ